MNFIKITADNLEREHICCAIADNKDAQVASKKAWLRDRFDEGLTFLKGDARGKCFIEYIPAEFAWAPVDAENYMYVDCLWVSGQLAGKGNGALLLERCINDSKAQGKRGLVILSSDKKRPYLSDPKFLSHHGFRLCDTASPYFALYALPFDAGQSLPKFKSCALSPTVEGTGWALYYTAQCPFTAKYVPLLTQSAASHGASMQTVRLESAQQAQRCPSPYTTFALFHNGEFVTHEILSPARFEKLLQEKGYESVTL